jgi:MarR family transcriptional regulator, organic hydroperoxide resistance regulator
MHSHRDNVERGEELSAAAEFPVSWLIFALARSHRALAGQLISNLGLYPGQELILMQLWDMDGRSQKELGEAQRLDHSTINKSVRRLEAVGLVCREPSPEDGRVALVFLTEKGRELETATKAAWAELERRTVVGLSEAEQRRFRQLALRIIPNIEPG